MQIEIQCQASGETCYYDDTDSPAEIGEALRAQGFIGSVGLCDAAGFARGWVSVSDAGEVDWSAV